MKITPRQALFEATIEENKGLIFKVANLYCKSAEDRQDLIQEIVLQIWHSFDKYNQSAKMSTWLYRIALNVAISSYRKRVRRKKHLVTAPLLDYKKLEMPDETDNEKEQQLQLLEQFITELKKLDRALMILYLEEKSHAEIADILGISTSNVATKIGRIKKKLKKQFSKYNKQ